jgi:fumarate reductase subunit D
MVRSNKPVIWALFAAGGTFAAFVTPAMIVVTGLSVAFGLLPRGCWHWSRIPSARG